MPFHTAQIPWLEIDHKKGKITCTRCKTTHTFSTDSPKGELEVVVDNVRAFARRHALCEEPGGTPEREGSHA